MKHLDRRSFLRTAGMALVATQLAQSFQRMRKSHEVHLIHSGAYLA